MGIGKRIREARISEGRTQEELAAALGITKSAVANYENETSHPREGILYRLFEVLHVDANYLFQDVISSVRPPEQLSPEERSHIEKYRMLSDYAKQTLNILIDRELSAPYAVSQISAAASGSGSASAAFVHREKTSALEASSAAVSNTDGLGSGADIRPLYPAGEPLQLYPYLNMVASAGSGSYADDIPSETVEAPAYPQADFIIGVNGSSMEPLYYDGDRLYVKRTDRLSEGEIGIFEKDGSLYVKKVGKDRLLSLNPDYPDIYPDSGTITSVGRVLAKVR